MPRASLREACNRFETFISDQRSVLRGIEAELNAIDRDRRLADQNLGNAVDQVFKDLDALPLEALNRAAATAKPPRDIGRMVAGLRQEDADRQSRIADLTEQHGTPSVIKERIATAQDQISSLHRNVELSGNRAFTMERKLLDVVMHNRRFPGHQLTEATRKSYESFSLVKYCFSKPYRSGRAAAASYNGNIDADEHEANDVAKSIITSSSQINETEERMAADRKVLADIRGLESSIRGPAGILKTVQATIKDMARRDPDFIKALSGELGAEVIGPIEAEAAKANILQKMRGTLDGHRQTAQKTLSQIESPMSKLTKGRSRAPSKQIEIDLDGIGKSLAAGKTYFGQTVANANKARAAVGSFTPATRTHNTQTNDMTNALLLWMVLDSGVPASFVSGSIAPDVGSILPGGGAFGGGGASADIDVGPVRDFGINAADIGVPDAIDIGRMGIDVPSFDVPTFDVPTINVPDISVPTDFGGGGGGFSSSSSFD